jgi:cell division protein FtsB
VPARLAGSRSAGPRTLQATSSHACLRLRRDGGPAVRLANFDCELMWGVIHRIALVVLIVLLAIGAVFVFLPPSQSIRQYQRKRLALQAENERLTEQIQELTEQQARFRSDPAFVERTAREAGMIKTNEVIFKLDEKR